MKYLFGLFLILSTPLLAYGLSQQPAAESYQRVDHQAMEQILNDYLTEQSELLPHIDLRFKSIVFPEPYTVAKGRIDHQIIPAKPSIIGSQRVTLLTRVDGQISSNQSIRIEVEALADIVVCAGTLRRGEILDAANVELRYQDISRLKEPIFSLEEVVGKRLKRSVRLGEPLQKTQVEFPPVIKRGERVVIQVESQSLMLSAAGEAKQDGQIGETIQVMNTDSHKEILCQVVASGLVKVEL
jgi:flagella basal body P-ring formation protein FlgA